MIDRRTADGQLQSDRPGRARADLYALRNRELISTTWLLNRRQNLTGAKR